MGILSIGILGCGNIGSAIAKGLVKSGMDPKNIGLTRWKVSQLKYLQDEGYFVTENNTILIEKYKVIIIAVAPGQIMDLLDEINSKITQDHLVISLVSGVNISELQLKLGNKIQIIRAMPNTAAILCESMTCLSSLNEFDSGLKIGIELFNKVGKTLVVDEEQMVSATALGACGVAFFLRAKRAATQGGIEIGFHSEEAFSIAAQTARGAATLLLNNTTHPESEIDKVTTPMGATISGLNEMEHQGFSSAMIKGITTSTEKVTQLFKKDS